MINLGEVTFGLGPDTTRLRASIPVLRRFGQEVNRNQQIVQNSANQNAAAYRKQEKTLVDSLNKVLSLNQQMAKVKGTAQFADQSASAFRRLNEQLTQGPRTALAYQRATEQFRTSISNTTREFRTFSGAAKGAEGAASGLQGAIKNAGSAFVIFQGPLGGVSTRLTTLSTLLGRTGVAVTAFTAGFATAGFAAYKFGEVILDVGKQVNSFMSQLEAITGSSIRAQGRFNALIKIARKTGTSIQDLAPAYAKFAVAAESAGVSVQDTFKWFEAVAAATAKLQLNAEQTSGVFRALEQMLSKGTVQAEELRGQLGDRLAGAVQIAAKAMGVTTARLQEMMKSGEVITTDFLPKFIEQLQKTLNINGKPIDNYAASVNRASTAWFTLRMEIDRQLKITDRAKRAWEVLADAIDFVRKNLGVFTGQIKLVRGEMANLRDYIIVIANDLNTRFNIAQTVGNEIQKMKQDLQTLMQFLNGPYQNTWMSVASWTEFVTKAYRELGMTISAMTGNIMADIADLASAINEAYKWLRPLFKDDKLDKNGNILPRDDAQWYKDHFKNISRLRKSWADLQTDVAKMWQNPLPQGGNSVANWTKEMQRQANMRAAVEQYSLYGSQAWKNIPTVNAPVKKDPANDNAKKSVELTEKQIKALKKQAEAMQRINDEIQRTYEEIDALGGTEATLNSATAAFKRADEVAKYGRALRKAGVDTQFIKDKTKELADALGLRDKFEKQRESMETLRDSFVSGFDSIGEAIVNGMMDGENALTSFKNVWRAAAADIINTYAKLAILNPLKNALFGLDEPTLGQKFGGPSPWSAIKNIFPGIFGPQGSGASSADKWAGMRPAESVSQAATNAMPAIGRGQRGSRLAGINFGGGGATNLAGANPASAAGTFAFWKSKGLPDVSAAAMTSAVKNESGFNPSVDWGDKGKAWGLYQWNDRRNSMVNAVGADWRNKPMAQHEFAYKEMMSSEGSAWKRLMAARNPMEATHAATSFERPYGFRADQIGTGHNFSGRLQATEEYMQKFGGSIEKSTQVVDKFTTNSIKAVNDNVGKLSNTAKEAASSVGATAKGMKDLGTGLTQTGQKLASAPAGGAGGGGLFDWLGKLFGFGGSSFFPAAPALGAGMGSWGMTGLFAKGGIKQNGIVRRFGQGGVMRSPMSFPMAGGGTAIAGERGANTEALMPLQKDSTGALAVSAVGAGGTPTVNIYIINKRGDDTEVSATKGTDANGNPMIQLIVDKVRSELTQDVASGDSAMNKAMEGRYNLSSAAGLKSRG